MEAESEKVVSVGIGLELIDTSSQCKAVQAHCIELGIKRS